MARGGRTFLRAGGDKIRIEDEQTIEWDYSGLHIILLYAIEGLDYWKVDGRDPYWLEGYEQTETLRGLLKIVLLASINAKNLEGAVKGVRHHANKDIERFRWIYDDKVDLPKVIEDFSNRHHPTQANFLLRYWSAITEHRCPDRRGSDRGVIFKSSSSAFHS